MQTWIVTSILGRGEDTPGFSPRPLADPGCHVVRSLLLVLAVASLLGVVGCADLPGRATFGRPERTGDPPSPATSETPPPERSSGASGPTASTGPIDLSDPEADEPLADRVVELGSGGLIGAPSPRSRASVASGAGGAVTLNVVDGNLREVVRLVLEDTLGVNYIIDPGIQGTITLQTTRPVPPDELLPMLDAVLRLNGAALVEASGLYKIVPIDQALTSGIAPDIEPITGAGAPGFTVRIVPLEFVGTAEMANVLGPFTPPGGSVQAVPERNLLVISGGGDQVQTLADLVSIFDVDWLRGRSIGLFPLTNADPIRLLPELEAIFGTEEGAPLADVVRFLPVERLNAMLVITSRPDYLQRVEGWIERLDQAGEGDTEQVYVYPVQNGRAEALADVLSQLFDIQTSAAGGTDLLAPGLDPIDIGSTTSGLGGSSFGGSSTGSGGSDLSADTGAGTGSSGSSTGLSGTQSRLGGGASGAAFGTSSPGGASFGSSSLGGAGGLSEGVGTRIIADTTTNSLVIRATPGEFRRIEDALRQLDILPLQVLIEATIAEVSLQDDLQFGVNFFFQTGDLGLNFTSGTVAGASPVFPGFNAIFDSDTGTRVVLNALDRVTDVNIVSAPQVLVLDNQTAELQVGDEVPILTQTATSTTDPDAPLVSTVEQRQTGVLLSVTPRVNSSGLVILEVLQEVSTATSTDSSNIDSPTISTRRLASTISVQSGETVALGGLIQETDSRTRDGVPFFSRIPLLGSLFRRQATDLDRTELLILLTPQVIRDPNEARSATAELRRRLRAVEPLFVD